MNKKNIEEIVTKLKDELLNIDMTLLKMDNAAKRIIDSYVIKDRFANKTRGILGRSFFSVEIDWDKNKGSYPYEIYSKSNWIYITVYFEVIKNIEEEPPEKLIIRVTGVDDIIDKKEEDDIDVDDEE